MIAANIGNECVHMLFNISIIIGETFEGRCRNCKSKAHTHTHTHSWSCCPLFEMCLMIVISRQSVSYENTGKRRRLRCRLRLRLQRLILQLIVGNCRFARAALCAYWMTRSMRQYQIWLEAISNEPSAPLCNRPLGQQHHHQQQQCTWHSTVGECCPAVAAGAVNLQSLSRDQR